MEGDNNNAKKSVNIHKKSDGWKTQKKEKRKRLLSRGDSWL